MTIIRLLGLRDRPVTGRHISWTLLTSDLIRVSSIFGICSKQVWPLNLHTYFLSNLIAKYWVCTIKYNEEGIKMSVPNVQILKSIATFRRYSHAIQLAIWGHRPFDKSLNLLYDTTWSTFGVGREVDLVTFVWWPIFFFLFFFIMVSSFISFSMPDLLNMLNIQSCTMPSNLVWSHDVWTDLYVSWRDIMTLYRRIYHGYPPSRLPLQLPLQDFSLENLHTGNKKMWIL